MKIPLLKAANKLGMHPIEVVVILAPLVNSFSDLYPNLDEGLIQTLEKLLHHPQTKQPELPRKLEELPQLTGVEKACLEKLARKKIWRHKTISEDVLKKSFLRNSNAPDKSIEKLVKLGLVVSHGKHRYSLNPQRKGIIEKASSRE